jgi:hypothetical protein
MLALGWLPAQGLKYLSQLSQLITARQAQCSAGWWLGPQKTLEGQNFCLSLSQGQYRLFA